jgi:Spy/CpxP family protein refolding chaperone
MKNKILIIIFTLSLIFQSCASTNKKNDPSQNQSQSGSTFLTANDLHVAAEKLILDDPDLTSEQKNKLFELRNKTHDKIMQYNQQSLNLKLDLMKVVMEKNPSQKKIKTLKKQIRKAEEQKLNALFDSVNEALKILNPQNDRHQKVMLDFLDSRGFHY